VSAQVRGESGVMSKKKKPEDVMMEDLSLLREKLRAFIYLVSRLKQLEDVDEIQMKLEEVRSLLEHIYMREISRLVRG
jgi:hypothetical protein